MEIDPSEVLLTFAEVSVAFAGFASVVAIFQRNRVGSGDEFDAFRFWVMLEFSLAALLFSLLPFVLRSMGIDGGALWSTGGGGLILFVVVHTVLSTRLRWQGNPIVLGSLTPAMSAVAFAAFSIIVAVQTLNIVGVFGRSFGGYLAGVFVLLFGASVNFVRLVWVGTSSRP